MYAASSAFKLAIKSDHIVVSKAEIWTSDQKLADLAIDSGVVNVSTSSAVRRTCSVSLTQGRDSTSLVPDSDFDLLTPFGNELRLFRGVQYDNGSVEYVPLGVFVITDVTINDKNDGVAIEVAGDDRSLIVSRNKWISPYQLLSGSLEASLSDLIKNRYPDALVSFPTTNITINQVVLGVEKENDPWKDAVEIAELVGYDLFFDADGIVQLVPFPSLDDAMIVASYQEGQGTTVISLDRNISTRETFNGIIYTLEGSKITTPIRIEIWDEDEDSPTYRYGKFGQVPIFITSNLLTTSDEAVKAAANLLNTYIGAQEGISWQSMVDPTLDVQDVVYIKSNGAKVDRLVILDSINIPLEASETMSATARTVRVVATDETIEIGA
jgi:hypothetical protein